MSTEQTNTQNRSIESLKEDHRQHAMTVEMRGLMGLIVGTSAGSVAIGIAASKIATAVGAASLAGDAFAFSVMGLGSTTIFLLAGNVSKIGLKLSPKARKFFDFFGPTRTSDPGWTKQAKNDFEPRSFLNFREAVANKDCNALDEAVAEAETYGAAATMLSHGRALESLIRKPGPTARHEKGKTIIDGNSEGFKEHMLNTRLQFHAEKYGVLKQGLAHFIPEFADAFEAPQPTEQDKHLIKLCGDLGLTNEIEHLIVDRVRAAQDTFRTAELAATEAMQNRKQALSVVENRKRAQMKLQAL